jgi:hypothetical protein
MVAAVVDVDHPPSDRKLARLLDQVDASIPGRGESVRQTSLIEHLARDQALDLGRDRIGQGERTEESAHRNHHHPDLAFGHASEQSSQLESRCEGRFGAMVGGAEIARNPSHAEIGCEQLEPGREIIDLRDVGHHHRGERGSPTAIGEGCHGQRTSAGNHPPDGQRGVAASERLDQRGQIRKGQGGSSSHHPISAGNRGEKVRKLESQKVRRWRGPDGTSSISPKVLTFSLPHLLTFLLSFLLTL